MINELYKGRLKNQEINEGMEELGRIKKEQIPKSIVEVLGTTNREIINTIVKDIIENRLDKKGLPTDSVDYIPKD